MRSLHLQPLVDWLSQGWLSEGGVPHRGTSGRSLRILDFGCGDLLLARMLPAATGTMTGIGIDGFDLSAPTRDAARAATNSTVFDTIGEIPTQAYDIVVAHSVLQYLDDLGDLADWMTLVTTWLAPGAAGAVMTDLPVRNSRRRSDAWDLIRHVTAATGPITATRQLLTSSRRSPGRLLTVDGNEVAGLAESAGLRARRLDHNLTPFRGRASYTLEPAERP